MLVGLDACVDDVIVDMDMNKIDRVDTVLLIKNSITVVVAPGV